MALIFDLNTGKFCEDAPDSKSLEPNQFADPLLFEEPALDLALVEHTLPASTQVQAVPADLTGTDASTFICKMERKDR